MTEYNSNFPESMGKIAPRELIANNIKNLNDAANYSEKDLLAIHGVGPKAIRIIKEELAKTNLHLKA